MLQQSTTLHINKWFRTLSETTKIKNLTNNDENFLRIKILNSYDDSKSEIKIDEKQIDFEVNQFNFINKPNISVLFYRKIFWLEF